MIAVLSLLDRPGLPAACAARGLQVGALRPAIALAALPDAGALAVHRWRYPALPTLALADAQATLLDAGADDVAPPDSDDATLAARLALLARRALPAIVIGDLAIDPIARTASRGGRTLRLRAREYALLARLAQAPGRVVTRATLYQEVFGVAFDPGTRAIEVHLSRLRGELDRAAPPMLHTERGIGYALIAPA